MSENSSVLHETMILNSTFGNIYWRSKNHAI